MANRIAVSEITESLCSGLVSGLVSDEHEHGVVLVGAQIVSSIFKDSTPTYFTDVNKQVEKIMHQELPARIVDQLNAEIYMIANWVMNEYIPQKSSSSTKQPLHELLKPQAAAVGDIIERLKGKSFRESSLTVYMLVAGLHLVLVQELAIVDPSVEEAIHSPYIQKLQTYATQYSDHVELVYRKIIDTRTAAISDVTISTKVTSSSAGNPQIIWYHGTFKDAATGYECEDQVSCDLRKKTCTDEDKNRLENKMKSVHSDYVEKIITNLSKFLNDPTEKGKMWRKLIINPIPAEKKFYRM